MGAEWRNNIWMCLELIIVGLVLWFIATFMITVLQPLLADKGYDVSTDIYVADVRQIDKDSPVYTEYPDSLHDRQTDMAALVRNMAANPYVEVVGTGVNAMPYNYNYSGNQIRPIDGRDSVTYQGNLRFMSPGMVRVMRLQGARGESPDSIAGMIERRQMLVTHFDFGQSCPPEQLVGREVMWGNDSSHIYTVGAVARAIHRSDYEQIRDGVMYVDIPAGWLPDQLAVRVKPGMGRQFAESLKASDMEFGNVYLCNLKSIEQMRAWSHAAMNTAIRNMIVCAVFLLVAVFLGFLGTFWFRTQQRVPEIAVRIVNGATSRQIFNRLLTEGLLLLGFSSVVMAAVTCAVVYTGVLNDIDGIDFGGYRPYMALAISVVLLIVIIVAGTWMPARRAMKVSPALALKDQ